jgi:histidinol phosphatase-like enzyme
MKLTILDKDGTLARPGSDGKWMKTPEDQVLLPGVAEGIAALWLTPGGSFFATKLETFAG